MARTIQTTVYTFDELTESAKETAVSKLSDINVNYEWWDGVYMDAENIGLKITAFDIDRNNHAKGEFIGNPNECAVKIMTEHGKDCDTYKLAAAFLQSWGELVSKYSDGVNTEVVTEDNEYDFDNDADELEREFLRDLLSEYAAMLQKECEYLQSDEAIIETIQANEYEFTADGDLI